jgi:hypothetical protein
MKVEECVIVLYEACRAREGKDNIIDAVDSSSSSWHCETIQIQEISYCACYCLFAIEFKEKYSDTLSNQTRSCDLPLRLSAQTSTSRSLLLPAQIRPLHFLSTGLP